MKHVLLGLGLLTLVVGGCADASDPRQGGNPVDSVSVKAPATPQADLGAAKPSVPEIEIEVAKTEFDYPFPDREDIFSPPVKKPSIATTGPEDNEDLVALMGFANAGEAQAILKIDGIVVPLRAGESHGEVRVLTIDPPRVTLQQRDRRWAESLAE